MTVDCFVALTSHDGIMLQPADFHQFPAQKRREIARASFGSWLCESSCGASIPG